MSLVLTVLAVIGRILLVILCIVLALLLLVLFVPIRYQMKVNRPDDEGMENLDAKKLLENLTAEVRASWLFHLVRANFLYPQSQELRVYVGPFCIFHTGLPEDDEEEDEEDSPKEDVKTAQAENTGATEVKQTDASTAEATGEATAESTAEPTGDATVEQADTSTSESSEDSQKNQDENPGENQDENPGDSPKSTKKAQKVNGKELGEKLQFQFRKIYASIKKGYRNLRYYVKVLQSETFHRAFDKCKREVFFLLKHILPRKWSLQGFVGLGDPQRTGQMLEATALLYPMTRGRLFLQPDFDRYRAQVHGYAKGHIRIITVLVVGIVVYFDKNIRRTITLFTREGNTNGRK